MLDAARGSPSRRGRFTVSSVRVCRRRKTAIDGFADIEFPRQDSVARGAVRRLLNLLDDVFVDRDRTGALGGVGAQQHVFGKLGEFGGAFGIVGEMIERPESC